MGDPSEAQKTRMLMGRQRVTARLMRFQMGMRSLLGTRLEAMHITSEKELVCILSMQALRL